MSEQEDRLREQEAQIARLDAVLQSVVAQQSQSLHLGEGEGGGGRPGLPPGGEWSTMA